MALFGVILAPTDVLGGEATFDGALDLARTGGAPVMAVRLSDTGEAPREYRPRASA